MRVVGCLVVVLCLGCLGCFATICCVFRSCGVVWFSTPTVCVVGGGFVVVLGFGVLGGVLGCVGVVCGLAVLPALVWGWCNIGLVVFRR